MKIVFALLALALLILVVVFAAAAERVDRTPGRLRVSFFWIFYSDYNVLELADDYSWVLVGGRSARYLWILARTPELPAETLDHILRLAEKRGYDTTRLLFTGGSKRPAE